MGIFVVILFMMLVVVQATEALPSCASVQDCDCVEKQSRAYELECPSVNANRSSVGGQVHIAIELGMLSVSCGGLVNYVELLPELEHSDTIDVFQMEDCALAEVSTLSDVIRRLGAHNPDAFQIMSSNMSGVTRAHLADLSHVRKLYLKANEMAALPPDLLYDMHELTYVEITNHDGLVVNEELFRESRNITYINMGQNRIENLPAELFANLSALSTLNLWANKLTHLSANMFEGLVHLSVLDVSVNELYSITTGAFDQLPQLQEVSMRKNQLQKLPAHLFRNNAFLKIIKLDDNPELGSLPDYFLANLTNLSKVSLSGCGLHLLPTNTFWGSSSLQLLDLSKNKLHTIQRDLLRDAHALEQLNMQSNELHTIDDSSFKRLKKLHVLRLGSNRINLTSNTLEGLSELQELYIPYNGLRKIDYRGLQHLRKLRIFDLSHNELMLVSPLYAGMSVLSHLTHLEKIYLEYNNLTDLFWDWRNLFTNLSEINLSHNRVQRLQVSDLNFVSKNDVLVYLDHNEIETVLMKEVETLWVHNHQLHRHSDTKRVTRVFLGDNPLRCDCSIYDLVRYLRDLMSPVVRASLELVVDELRCAAPEAVCGLPPVTLSPNTLTCELVDGPRPAHCAYRPLQYRVADDMLVVNCSRLGLYEAPDLSELVPYKKNIELHLELNELRTSPTAAAATMGYEYVRRLHLEHNQLMSIEWLPTNVTDLYLHNNKLHKLNSSELALLNKTSVRNVSLHDNPWQCDCDIMNLTKYLQENFKRVLYLNNVTCNGTDRVLTTLTASELCYMEEQKWIATGVALGAAGVLIGLLFALFYKYQQEIKVWLYAHNLCMYFLLEEELDKDKLFDAFISYSHEDEEFVVNELVARLEDGPTPYKLCLHYRNWQPGELIATNIARSVADSRRTLVVLSPAFLRSEWGKMEFRTAHVQALSEGRARVIVIIVGDVGPVDDLDPELRAYLTTNTYVKWGDPWFWNKVRYALPHRTIKPRPILHQPARPDKLGLVLEPSTPPASTTPPADHLHLDPLLKRPHLPLALPLPVSLSIPTQPLNALNVALINGTLVNEPVDKLKV